MYLKKETKKYLNGIRCHCSPKYIWFFDKMRGCELKHLFSSDNNGVETEVGEGAQATEKCSNTFQDSGGLWRLRLRLGFLNYRWGRGWLSGCSRFGCCGCGGGGGSCSCRFGLPQNVGNNGCGFIGWCLGCRIIISIYKFRSGSISSAILDPVVEEHLDFVDDILLFFVLIISRVFYLEAVFVKLSENVQRKKYLHTHASKRQQLPRAGDQGSISPAFFAQSMF